MPAYVHRFLLVSLLLPATWNMGAPGRRRERDVYSSLLGALLLMTMLPMSGEAVEERRRSWERPGQRTNLIDRKMSWTEQRTIQAPLHFEHA